MNRCEGSGQPAAEEVTAGTPSQRWEAPPKYPWARGRGQVMAKYARGRCPVCRRVASVRTDGLMWPHHARRREPRAES